MVVKYNQQNAYYVINFSKLRNKKGCVELNIVELKDIGKNYGKKVALKSVNLQIPEGIYGILGNNGAGKTTLLRMITLSLIHI